MEFLLNKSKSILGNVINKMPQFPVLNDEQKEKIKKLTQPPVLSDEQKKNLQLQIMKLTQPPTKYKQLYEEVNKKLPENLELLKNRLLQLNKLPQIDKNSLLNLVTYVNKLHNEPVLYVRAIELLNTRFNKISIPTKQDSNADVDATKLNAAVLKLITPIKKLSPVKSKSNSKSNSNSKSKSSVKCPEGKMINPKTGRCITIKNKKITPVKKECPEGKMINPNTGRCITIKNKKVTPVKKECPEGKMINPKTGRCITIKEKKKVTSVKAKKGKTTRSSSDKYEIINGKRYKKCKPGQIRNENNRCVNVNKKNIK